MQCKNSENKIKGEHPQKLNLLACEKVGIGKNEHAQEGCRWQKNLTVNQKNKENEPVWDKNEIKIEAFWS